MKKIEFTFPAIEEALVIIREAYPSAEDLPPEAESDLVSSVLERILSTPDKKLASLLSSFTPRERVASVHAYAEASSTRDRVKVVKALLSKPSMEFILPAWHLAQEYIEDSMFMRTLTELARRLESRDVQLERVELARVVLAAPDAVKYLLKHMDEEPQALLAWTRSFGNELVRIQQDGKLFTLLEDVIYREADLPLLRKQSVVRMFIWAKGTTDSKRQDFGVNYLSKIPLSDCYFDIVEYLIERYGLPAKGHEFWRRVPEKVRKALQSLIAERMLNEFFEGINDPERRFEFWKRFKDDLHDIHYPRERQHALLVFQGIFVAEFRDMGNAAYIYDVIYLDGILKKLGQNNANLKEKYHFDRIVHREGWQFAWEHTIKQYLTRGV